MKWIPVVVAALSVSAGLWAGSNPGESAVLIVGGDTHGYLSPCGCTKPMTGGIRRRATLMRQLASGKLAAVVENGGLVAGRGSQDQMKAEALAEIYTQSGFDAVHLGFSESKLGVGGFKSLTNLLPGIGLVSSLAPSTRFEWEPVIEKGPFAIVGVDSRASAMALELGERAAPVSETLSLLEQSGTGKKPVRVVLFQGTLDEAKRLPGLDIVDVVVFRSTGAPDANPARVGRTIFVSPGEKGKHVLALSFVDGAFSSYKAFPLPPDVADDPVASRIFERYLSRVDKAGLLEKLPRKTSPAFSGNQKCGSCHTQAFNVWKKSMHAKALATLEKSHQSRDPDCVGCHVVGLDAKGGFVSRTRTPQLANVGCESCHGAGAKHSTSPKKFRMPKVGAKSCVPCHVPNHSPGFEFEAYWKKIRH